MGMRRYLVVLDMDLLAADEELDLEPIDRTGCAQRACVEADRAVA